MKSKNKKRIGPVPITLVAVFALAAFLSVGLLLATNGVQPAEAQSADCEVENTLANVACTANGDMATIEFTGSTTVDRTTTVHVYVVHDDGEFARYPKDTTYDATSTEAAFVANNGFSAAAIKFDYQTVEIAAPVTKNLVLTASSTTITVANGTVHVHAGLATYVAIGGAPEGSEEAFAADPGAVVTITFLGAPVEKADDVTVSALALTDGGIPLTDVVAGEVVTASIANLDENADSVQISAEFSDENGENVVGNIVFTIGTPSAGAEDVKFDAGGTERTAFTSSVGSFTIVDIPEDIAVRIPVTATFTGETGTLTLEGNIIRWGDATMITANAYACKIDEDDTEFDDTADPKVAAGMECTSEIKALKKSGTEGDPKEIGALQDEDIFTIFGEAVDMLGNKLPGPLTWKATPDTDTDTGDVLPASGTAETVITVDADDDELGSYSITVESADEVVSTIIEFAVSGPPKLYQIEGPAEIEIDGDGFASYMVTATDVNGNPAAGTNCVTVRVRGLDFEEDQDLSAPMSAACAGDTDETEVGETFTIDAPPGIAAGTTATIQIRVDGEVKARTVITFVSMTVVAPPMLGDASGLMAAAGADAGMVELTWTPGPNATMHFVAGVKQSDLDAGTANDSLIWTAADNPGSHTVTGLDSGEVYLFVVIAGDADGWGAWTTAQMVTPS